MDRRDLKFEGPRAQAIKRSTKSVQKGDHCVLVKYRCSLLSVL